MEVAGVAELLRGMPPSCEEIAVSRTVDTYFRFARPVAVNDLIVALERAGWIFGENGRMRYLVDPDLFDWDESPTSDRPAVMKALESAALGAGGGFQLSWPNGMQAASLLSLEAGRLLTFSPFGELVYRDDVDGFLNHEWYLSRTLPVLCALGLTGYKFEDSQD